MPGTTTPLRRLRARLSDRLLATALEIAVDREATARRIAAAPGSPAVEAALGTLRTAALVDSALLWLSWRLRPRTIELPERV